MLSRIGRLNMLGAAAVLALIFLGAARLQAQTTTTPPSCSNPTTILSSFEFPLWNDAIGWQQPNAYSSIQMADIDGDGQEELLGNGPSGVEVWHWEPNGQAWMQMGAGPTLASTDTLMTADVDGDGQAEIIQITSNLGSSPVVNVWHYDGGVNPQFNTGPGVWRIQPQLKLTLTPSVGSNSTPLAPIIKFANLAGPANKQQALVSLAINVSPGIVHYTPFTYQLNTAKTGWTAVQGPITNGGGTFANSSPGTMQLGDITGDGLPDIVVLEGSGNFLIFRQNPLSASGQSSFATGTVVPVPKALSVYSFALADALGAGYKQIFVSDLIDFGGSSPIPGVFASLQAFQFNSASGLTQLASMQDGNLPFEYATLQSATTGLNAAKQTILMLDGSGLEEYSLPNFKLISQSPFLSQARFGDIAAHYQTIQTGRVLMTDGQTMQTVLVARDTSGIHTLPTRSAGQVCNSNPTLPGFQVVETDWYPAFTGNQANAYTCVSNIATANANAKVFSLLGNKDSVPGTYSSTLMSNGNNYCQATSYTGAGCTNPNEYTPEPAQGCLETFSASDYMYVYGVVKAALNGVVAANQYVTQGQTSANYIFAQEQAQLPIIEGQISQQDSGTGDLTSLYASAPLNALSAVTDFLGNTGIPVLSQVSEVFSVIGTIVSDIQEYENPPATICLSCKELTMSGQASAWFADLTAANLGTNNKIINNFDLATTLNQQIGTNTISSTDTGIAEAEQQAVTGFELKTWQTLASQAWKIFGVNGDWSVLVPSTQTPPPLASSLVGYPSSLYYVNRTNTAAGNNCSTWTPNLYGPGTWYTVFLEPFNAGDLSTPLFGSTSLPATVPASVLNILTSAPFNVNIYDILGRRNGWQNIPFNGDDWCFPFQPAIPADPAATTPTPLTPATLTVTSAGESIHNDDACSQTGYQQQTPINSVFPAPLTLQVQSVPDPNSDKPSGVSGATVQISGQGLSPSTFNVVTDSNGFATVSLLANNIVQPLYPVNIQLVSPHSSSSTSCDLNWTIYLQNTAAVSGAPSPDVQAVVSVTGKGAIFTNDRLWNLSIIDPTGLATGGTVSGQLTHTRGPATCNPVPVISDALHPTAVAGQLTSRIGWDFSSCTGLNLFTLTVTGNFTIPLDNDTSYSASFSASTNNQTP